MGSELRRTFTSALESLPARERQLITLNETGGLNTEGIGHALGITRAQARVGLLHARLAMRQQLSDRMRVAAQQP